MHRGCCWAIHQGCFSAEACLFCYATRRVARGIPMDSDGNALFNLVHNIESGGTAHCCLAPMMLAMQAEPVPPFPLRSCTRP